MLTAENLQHDAISHGFFTRRGGVSSGIFASLNCGPGSGDDSERVAENRNRVRRELGAVALASLYQVHSAGAVTLTQPWDDGHRPRADAMATNVPGIALGILTADCAPVLLADTQANVVGAAHAGWKGALHGVTDSAIAEMENLGADRARIAAAVGPCISQENYEVGAEFLDAFRQADSANAQFFAPSNRVAHLRFNLEGYVVHRLLNAGVRDVRALHACTYARADDFFSYRRTTHCGEEDYGRQISAIALK